MSNSPLAVHTRISPNSSMRTAKIDAITIHHMGSDALSIEACGAGFASRLRGASSNYGVGSDGRIGLYVDESRRSWCSNSWPNDDRAVTIEVANDGREPDWHVSDAALEATIALCTDICIRNNIPRLNFTGDPSGNLTMHRWFGNTICPGPYLGSKFPYIAEEVNRRLAAAGVVPKEEAPEDPNALRMGDVITIVPGSCYTTGKVIPEWILQKTLYCRAVVGDEVTFSILKEGRTTGTTTIANVRKAGQALGGQTEPTPDAKPKEEAPAAPSQELKVGDVITLLPGTHYTTGKAVPDWVMQKTLYCRAITGGNVTFSILKEGGITGTTFITNVRKNGVTVEKEPVVEQETTFRVGDAVRLKVGAKYIDGKSVPDWVVKRTVYVRQIYSNGNIVFSIFKVGGITGTTTQNYLEKY